MKKSWKKGLVLFAVFMFHTSVVASASDETDAFVETDYTEQNVITEGDAIVSDDEALYQEGWNGTIEDNDCCYVDAEGNKITGLNCIDGKWYLFDESGLLAVEWQTVDGKTYYFSPETGERYENGSYLIGEEEYTFDENGELISVPDSEPQIPSENEDVKEPEKNEISDDGTVSPEDPESSIITEPEDAGVETAESDKAAQAYRGWHRESEGWYYYNESGQKVTGWIQLGNIWYYLDGSNTEYPGLMATGKKQINGYTYFFEDGGAMQTGWIARPEGKYYAYAGGNQAYGWLQLGGAWYYFDKGNAEYPGLMISGGSKVINGHTYYFNADGSMQTGWVRRPEGWYYTDINGSRVSGWLQLGSSWYYLDGSNTEYPGLMVTGKKEINGYTYFFEGGGVMLSGWVKQPEGWYYAHPGGNQKTGWLQLGSSWYYLDANNEEYPGLMVTGKKEINGYTYFFNSSGVMQTGWVRQPEGWYYAHPGGNQRTGWLQLGSKWYYLDANNEEYPGLMVSGPKEEINGYTYFFEGGGVMLTGWVKQPEGWYYAHPGGNQAYGWLQLSTGRYYLDRDNVEYPGLMVSSCTMEIDGQEYTFRSDGRVFTGWKYVSGEGYYYYDPTGLIASGWRQVNNKWYYMDPGNNNIMAHQQWKQINGYWYYFRKDGDMATNWIYVGGNYYYLASDGVMRTGWQWIDGDRYYFYKENDPNGGGWGVMAHDTTIDGIRIDSSGRADVAYTYAIDVLNQIGWDLRAAFNWSASLPYTSMSASASMGSEWFARYGFENRTGNCYVMAATFYYMAKAMGYDAHQIAGYVPMIGGGSTPHSWVEIVIGGTVYVYDPDFTYETGGNGFQIRYGTSGTWRYSDYYRMN